MSLNSQQQAAVDYNEGHLLIVAGPGTGKTHTITQKIFHLLQHQKIRPENIVAMTFTRKAGEQLALRLQKLLPNSAKLPFAGTFHSFCLQILRSHLKTEIKIISQKEQQELLKSVGDDENHYQKKLAELNVLDFDGILVKALEIIQNDTQLKQNLRQKILYLFVDEYQDINEAQYFLIKELTGPQTKICAIGDPDQAIYAFRGSNLEHFLRFEEDFPGTKVLQLEENYRSTGNIIECSSALIEHNSRRVHKNLRGIAQTPAGPRISYMPCQTPLSEAIWIAKEIGKLVGGTNMTAMDQKTGNEYETHYHFTDITVIYRTNIQGKMIEHALKKEGLPIQRLAAVSWFNEDDIHHLLQQLSFVLSPQNISGEYEGFRPQYQELNQNLKDLTPSQTVKSFLAAFNIEQHWSDGTPKGEKRWANVLRLLNFAIQFDEGRAENELKTMIDELKLLQEHDAYDERMQAVTLMTIHASKGLEFPVVFIAGLEEGTLPYLPKKNPGNDIEEERRLFYVGLTRAKERIFLTNAKARHEKPVQASTFIREISTHLTEIQPPKLNTKTVWKKKQLTMW